MYTVQILSFGVAVSIPVSTRLSSEVKNRLDFEAVQKGVTVSKLMTEIITKHYQESDDISGRVDRILEESLQVEGLMTVMMIWQQEVFATLLGRTDEGTMTREQRVEAIERKSRAAEALQRMLNEAAKKTMEGESAWGKIPMSERSVEGEKKNGQQ